MVWTLRPAAEQKAKFWFRTELKGHVWKSKDNPPNLRKYSMRRKKCVKITRMSLKISQQKKWTIKPSQDRWVKRTAHGWPIGIKRCGMQDFYIFKLTSDSWKKIRCPEAGWTWGTWLQKKIALMKIDLNEFKLIRRFYYGENETGGAIKMRSPHGQSWGDTT